MNKVISSLVSIVIIAILACFVSAAPKYDCTQSAEGSRHGNAGAQHWENGQLDFAEKETREAIKIDSNCSMWHQNLGFILESKGNYDEASKSWLKSLEIDKDWCTSYKTGSLLKLGLYYYDKKRDYGKSIQYLEKALSVAKLEEVDNDLLSSIYLYLSYNYTEPKEYENSYYNLRTAEELKKKALDLNPDNLFIKASLTKLLILQNKLNEANRNISDIISAQEKSLNPNPGVYSYLAHIYSLLKDPKNAAHYMEKAIDLDRGQAEYLLNELDKDFRQVSSSNEMQCVITMAKELIKK
jgi:tetratricopeptide (TPR) repeat protein